jgi:WD40 repeat protein
LVRENPDSPTFILDARTGAIAAGLPDAGPTFDRNPIQNDIINLDDTNTLHIYDSATASLLLTLENVEDLPFYTADRSRLAVNIIDSGIQVYNTDTYTLDDALDGFRTELIDFRSIDDTKNVWSPDGTMLSVVPIDSANRFLGPRHIWTAGDTLSAPIYNITDDMAWSPDGSQMAAPSDLSKVRIYDSTTGELLETIPDIPDTPVKVEWWTQNGILIKSGSYRVGPVYLSLWNPQRHEFALQTGVGLETHYIQDNRLISIAFGYAVRIFDIETGQLQRESLLRGPHWHSPNLRWMAEIDWTTADNDDDPRHVYMSHLETMELVADIEMESDFIPEISWSPDSQFFATVSNPTTTIWKIVESP